MTPREGPARAGIYIRVSLENDANLSLANQEARCRALCEARGWTVHRLYRDEASGTTMEGRPGLAEMLADARAGRINVLVVLKTDRLTRRLADLLDIVQQLDRSPRVSLVSVTEPINTEGPTGRLILEILAVVASFEAEQIRGRRQEATSFRKSRGLAYGPQVPFGLTRLHDPSLDRVRTDGTTAKGYRLVPVPEQMEAVKAIYLWRGGGWTMAKIAAELERRGVPTANRGKTTKRGVIAGTWKAEQVRSILRNDIYQKFLMEAKPDA